jgi:hypothetical protein
MQWKAHRMTEETMIAWGAAVAEDREEGAEGGLDQDEIGDVPQTGADPEPEGRREARVVAEPLLGVENRYPAHPLRKCLTGGSGVSAFNQGTMLPSWRLV